MSFRQTAILLSVVLVVGLVLLVIAITSEDKTPETDVLTEELVGVKPEQIDIVEIERNGVGRVKLVRTEAGKNSWEIVEPYRVPANGSVVEPVIIALMSAKPTIDPDPTDSLAARDLEPPSMKIILHQGTERSSTVNLGFVTIGGSKGVVYVTTSARPKRPIAVPRNELDALFKEPKGNVKAGDIAKWTNDFRTHTIFPGDTRAMGEDVASLKLDLPNKKKELALSRTPSGGWKFDAPAGWGEADTEGGGSAALNTFTGVNPLLRALTNMSATSAGDFIDNPKDLKQYGLNQDNPDRVRVEMKTKDGKSAVVYIGKMELGGGTSGKAYVMVEGQPGVIHVNASPSLAGLIPTITDPSPLRDRTLITVDPRKQVDGLDIVLAGQPADKPTKLRLIKSDPRSPGHWMLYGGPNDPQNAYTAPVSKIVSVVTAQRAIKDFPPPNPENFKTISATLYVWVDGFSPPPSPKAEPVKRAEPTKLEFGRKEGDTIYVRRTRPGGQVNEFTIPAMLPIAGDKKHPVDALATVSKSRLDLLDPSLPTFGSDAVQKLTVTGQNNYTLEKDAKPDPSTHEVLWRFTAPEPKGRTADTRGVEEILRLLGTTQSVTRFVDETPTQQKLAEYGITPAPRLKAVVGLKGEERIYEFGKDTPDPAYVYARFNGKGAVFTLPRLVFDTLAKPDLRDHMVFRSLPTTDAKRVEFRGWAGLVGKSQIRIKLEKNKDGQWVVTPSAPGAPANAPAGFVPDTAKINAFLQLLAKTRAETFETGKPEPKHGFGDDAPFLEVNVYGPDGKLTFVNIGAPTDNGLRYFAVTNAVPPENPVITIDAAPFKPYKEKPTAFAK